MVDQDNTREVDDEGLDLLLQNPSEQVYMISSEQTAYHETQVAFFRDDAVDFAAHRLHCLSESCSVL